MKKTLLFLVLLLFTGSQMVTAADVKVVSFNQLLTMRFITAMNNQDFTAAAKLFHYPPGYTKVELDEDLKGVKTCLRYIDGKFGKMIKYTPYQNQIVLSEVMIGGGTSSYWLKNPIHTYLLYQVDFQKAGEGYLRFWFCNINGASSIRAVKYGFPLQRENTAERMTQIYQEMNQLINSKDGTLK